jgi:hypothetical protein
MEMDDFNLMVKGFFEKRKAESFDSARIAAVIDGFAAGLAQDKTWSVKKFIKNWFGEKDPEIPKADRKARSAEMMKRVKLTNQILEEKKKRGRAAKNSN